MKKIVILIFVTVLIATTWIYFDGSKMDNSILDEKTSMSS